ncbi:DUF1501 domain-containing protein [Novosphingopyxis sp.]|uniref:DUF1501 domain-containing protein n=1 Tax=Novosphingopyxis sp. TaxID=2709690 RepID=UPI003B59D0D7
MQRAEIALALAEDAPQMLDPRTVGQHAFLGTLARDSAAAIAAPTGDPAFVAARGALAEAVGRHPVGDFFALHPEFTAVFGLAQRQQALLFHAVGLSNPSRSHFDAQNLFETGGNAPYAEKTGILNRMLELTRSANGGLALSQTVPPALSGPQKITSYAPGNRRGVNADLAARIAGMYEDNPKLAAVWQEGVETRTAGMAAADGIDDDANRIGALAAQFLLEANAPDIVMIESNGWDTHSNEPGRLARTVRQLDGAIDALHVGLGETWNDTLVIAATEFGRTVAVNGNVGSDHGTGGMMMALGGALPRGGVVADWPGLAGGQLFEARDLRTTIPVEGAVSALVALHYGLEPNDVAGSLYPAIAGLKAARL